MMFSIFSVVAYCMKNMQHNTNSTAGNDTLICEAVRVQKANNTNSNNKAEVVPDLSEQTIILKSDAAANKCVEILSGILE